MAVIGSSAEEEGAERGEPSAGAGAAPRPAAATTEGMSILKRLVRPHEGRQPARQRSAPKQQGGHMITVSAFKWVPDFARGQVRDLRVRWALEEAGLPYKT